MVALHPRSAAGLAKLVRIMNAYYSNLIEGHNTRPRDIERALAGDLDANPERRNLQEEAAAHVRVQEYIDRLAASSTLPEPASEHFISELHRRFYADGPAAMLEVEGARTKYRMVPGRWRESKSQDVAVGRHVPPSSRMLRDLCRISKNVFGLRSWAKDRESWRWQSLTIGSTSFIRFRTATAE